MKCGNSLKAPTKEQLSGLLVTADDSDGDGISNEVERQYNLNPDDPNDAAYDADGDGFSNIYEIENKTSPTNANDHPPLWHRLVLKQVSTVTLPVELKVVNTMGSADKSQWEIQYNLPRTHRRTKQVQTKSYFVPLGEEIQVDENDKRRYAIIDAQHLPAPTAGDNKQAVKTPAPTGENGEQAASNAGKFIVKLREVVDPEVNIKAEEITMITGQPVKSADVRPEFEDTGRPGSRTIICRVGTDIVMTNTEGGKRSSSVARYRIVECKPKNDLMGIKEDMVVLAIVDSKEKDSSKWEKITIKKGIDQIEAKKRVSKDKPAAAENSSGE